MNQRKAIPANGTSASATRTASRREPSLSQSPLSVGSSGTDRWMSTSAAANSTEKAIPATAADRGVRRAWRRVSCSVAIGAILVARSRNRIARSG